MNATTIMRWRHQLAEHDYGRTVLVKTERPGQYALSVYAGGRWVCFRSEWQVAEWLGRCRRGV